MAQSHLSLPSLRHTKDISPTATHQTCSLLCCTYNIGGMRNIIHLFISILYAYKSTLVVHSPFTGLLHGAIFP